MIKARERNASLMSIMLDRRFFTSDWLALSGYLVFLISAFAFQGGMAIWIAGMVVIDSGFGRASRLRCVGRAAILWTPPFVLALSSIHAIELWPFRPWIGAVLSWAWLSLLGVYFVTSLRPGSQHVHDRIVGTRLVCR